LKVAPTLLTLEKITDTKTEETNLGKVKTEQIKHLGKELMTRFPGKFTTNFDENKRTVDDVTKGTTTRVRNKVAGYITRTIALAQASSAMESEIEEEIAE
jgi:small subunit ribosomal protein S17e